MEPEEERDVLVEAAGGCVEVVGARKAAMDVGWRRARSAIGECFIV